MNVGGNEGSGEQGCCSQRLESKSVMHGALQGDLSGWLASGLAGELCAQFTTPHYKW